MGGAFKRGDAGLEGVARGIARSRVFVPPVDAHVRLGVGARLEDGDDDGTGRLLGILAGVDRLGLEIHHGAFRLSMSRLGR